MHMPKQVETSAKPPKLPEPRPIRRRVKLYRYQVWGMGLLLVLPALALAGLFQSESTQISKKGEVSLNVSYHRILRDRTDKPLLIRAINDTGKEIEKLTLSLNRDYVSEFDEMDFNPEPAHLTSEKVVFEFDKVAPEDSREVTFDFQADKPGVKKGHVEADSGSGAKSSLEFSTFVLP